MPMLLALPGFIPRFPPPTSARPPSSCRSDLCSDGAPRRALLWVRQYPPCITLLHFFSWHLHSGMWFSSFVQFYFSSSGSADMGWDPGIWCLSQVPRWSWCWSGDHWFRVVLFLRKDLKCYYNAAPHEGILTSLPKEVESSPTLAEK